MSAGTSQAASARSRAEVATQLAARYLQQLCKHFGHRRPATFDAAAGSIAFEGGTCRLAATADRLTLTLEAAGPAALAELQEVVASHLLRFAFREALSVEWRQD